MKKMQNTKIPKNTKNEKNTRNTISVLESHFPGQSQEELAEARNAQAAPAILGLNNTGFGA